MKQDWTLSECWTILECMSEYVDPPAAAAISADPASWLLLLAEGPRPSADAERIDEIRALEELKSVASARQARIAVDFERSQLAEQRAAHVRERDLGKGISAQVALARRESACKGSRLMGLAKALVHELPHTMAALSAGEISEWRATIVTRETAHPTRDHRAEVDSRLGPRLGMLSDRQLTVECRRVAYELDPIAALKRCAKAIQDRRVSVRPAPDVMAVVSALLPMAAGVAVVAALKRAADDLLARGDVRSRNQIMADTLVERVTGVATADQIPVEIQLVINEKTLFGDDDTPAHARGYGPVPAPYARHLIRGLDDATAVWLSRVWADPTSGQLVKTESKRRLFTGGLRRQVGLRDDICRTPWCGAPIRHIDHVVPSEDGGPTSEANGQGLCEACNYAKQAFGWRSRPSPKAGAGEWVEITTPTGHRYMSHPPPLPGADPRPDQGVEHPQPKPDPFPIEVYIRGPLELRYVA